MTEAKSPREIAEQLVALLPSLTPDARLMFRSDVAQALVSYAAERERLLAAAEGALAMRSGELQIAERLLAEADQVLDAIQRDEMGGLYDGNNGELFTQAIERHKSRLSSRPATEGKGDD